MNHASSPNLLLESTKGCLLVQFWENDCAEVVKWSQENIDQVNLVDSGYERESHITVLYGFEPSIAPEAVCDFVAGTGELMLKLEKISKFSQETCDVIKIDVKSESMTKLHRLLKQKFNVKTSYPDYHPHLTLAYVKPGSCDHLLGNCRFEGQIYFFDLAVYSTPGSAQRFIATL
jgi:2'-5' RNA ligase